MRRLLVLVLVGSCLAACGSKEGGGESGSVAAGVAEQLAYLHSDSALVAAIDLRYEGENWESLRGIVGRVLDEARKDAGPGDDVPTDAEAALDRFARFWDLSFEEDVRPVLDGRLVVGTALVPVRGDPPERVTVVYRTEGGDLRGMVEKVFDDSPPRPLPGRDDVVIADADGITVALVGDDTLVATETREEAIAAIERADAGDGFSAELLDAAERGAGIDDPLLLATATPELAARFLDGVAVERAISEVPYLGAIERVDLALDASGDGVEARAQVATTGASLRPDQLPLGPAGDVELPRADGAVAGGSLDQSRITTFAASVMRSMFADSEFVAAVEETERELGISFEDEVLRQFYCPSVSVFEPEPGQPVGVDGRFSARSCVRDPERMRELLPELAPRLPRILRAMRGLSGEGLLGLLMLAPDAPLSPGALLLQVDVGPLAGGATGEQLYEATGLRDNAAGENVFPGPDLVVFGMIGDDFVVGSDLEAARDVAALETEPAGEPAAAVLRVPAGIVSAALSGWDEAVPAVGRTFDDMEIAFSADPRATRAHARMPLAD